MIEHLRHGVADKIDRRILRRVLIYLSTVYRTPERRRLIVHVGENNGDFGTNRRRRIDLRHFLHRNLQDEGPIAVLFCFPVQLRSGEHEAGSSVNIEQISRPLRDAIRHFVVYPLVTVHGAYCEIRFVNVRRCTM